LAQGHLALPPLAFDPPPYAMTDANGLELSDRFQEALTIKNWAQDIWTEVVQEKKRLNDN